MSATAARRERETVEAVSSKGQSGPPAKDDRFPSGIPFIVGNEGAERFSFYGMRAILYVYMTALLLQFKDQLGLDPALVGDAKAQATQINHLFIAGVYAFPMIGAILSDRLLGKYNVILWVSSIYCAGHAALAVAGRMAEMGMFSQAKLIFFAGLALIAIGSGGIKPCVSANVGDQFSAANGHLVTKVYQIFYFIINFGSFLSTIITPLLYKYAGAEVAFGVPGILMGVATLVFWMGRHKFVRQPPNPGGKLGALDFLSSMLLFTPLATLIVAFFAGEHGQAVTLATFLPHIAISIAGVVAGLLVFSYRQKLQPDDGFIAVMLHSFRNQSERKPGQGFFDVARAKFGDEAAEGPPAVLRVMVVFSMVSVFWALFDQHSSTWVEQAGQMALGLTVPKYLGFYGVGAVLALTLHGGIWLFLWISNNRYPKPVQYAVLGTIGAVGVAAAIADLVLGEWNSFELQASQLSALNPVLVMMVIPLLNVAVYKPLEKRGITVKPLQKMGAGMFLAAAAFAIGALLQLQIEATAASGTKVHALWQVFQYLVMTTSEVLVSVTGLEFAYTQAPRKMKSTIMGFWLLCVTFGNMLVAFLAPLQAKYALSQFFLIFTGLMVGAAIIFSVLAYFYKGKTYLQKA
jgi:POT family proton-dependent oligopeptide transporter